VEIETSNRLIEIWDDLARSLVFYSFFFSLGEGRVISVHTVEIEIDLASILFYCFDIAIDEIEFSSLELEYIAGLVDRLHSAGLITMCTADDSEYWARYS
jgi:hypothetical protein